MKRSRFRILVVATVALLLVPGATLPAHPRDSTARPDQVHAQDIPLQRSLSGGPPVPLATILAPQGCAMAHCDRRMSDNANIVPPLTSSVSAVWRDTLPVGSKAGLGCSSNGSVAVCTFTADPARQTPTVVAYSASGDRLWSSSLLNDTAYASAPIIDSSGGAIVADNERMIRFDAAGNVIWNTPTAGGTPLSPTFTDNGAVVLATSGGPVSAYAVQSGELIGQLALTATLLIDNQMRVGMFDTVNTPAVYGNRVYISTQFKPLETGTVLPYGRLYALDIDRPDDGTAAQISVAWYYAFRGPSGASPLIIQDGTQSVIYFDGDGLVPGGPIQPAFFAVRDVGTSPELDWHYDLPTPAAASAAQDPRGGLWIFATRYPELLRLSGSGQPLQRIDLDALVGADGDHIPGSVMTIAGTDERPIMLVSAATLTLESWYVTAIDLASERLLWKYRIDEDKGRAGGAFGQFPIVKPAGGEAVVVLSTSGNGVWGLTSEYRVLLPLVHHRP